MTNYAFFSRSQPLSLSTIEDQGDSQIENDQSSQDDMRRDLVAIYESYAELYPNPKLVQEYQEREKLLKAASAANYAVNENPPKKEKTGFWTWIWGSEEESRETPKIKEEDLLVYKEIESIDDTLCGARASLDVSCIPREAISAARFHLSSTRTRRSRPNVARMHPSDNGNVKVVAVVGVGAIAEFHETGEGTISYTSDREDLLDFVAQGRGSFDLSYVRAAFFAPNFLAISWGLMDGVMIFYRRTQDNQWEAVSMFGPTRAVLENLAGSSDGLFMDEPEATLLVVTDIVPLVVEVQENEVPAVSVAVSRLGGYIEVLPLPPQLWHGQVLPGNNQQQRKNRRRKQLPESEHYAIGKLRDLSVENLAVAISTEEYHVDTLCLEAFRTRVGMDTEWDTQAYADSPPSEYVLVASGMTEDSESLSFWAITTMFLEGEDPQSQGLGFSLHVRLLEAIDLGRAGSDVSVFANETIMKHWRHPRLVELRDSSEQNQRQADASASNSEQDSFVKSRVTIVSAPAPIVGMNFTSSPMSQTQGLFGHLLAILDWNGSVSIMNCSVLERAASHSLSQEEYRIIYQNENNEDPVPLVTRIASRSRMMKLLSPFPSALNLRWLERSVEEESLLMLLTEKPSKLIIISKVSDMVTGQVPSITSISFPAGDVSVDRSPSEIPYLVSYKRKKNKERLLSCCVMQPLEPRDIIRSLAQSSKFKQALEATKVLSNTDQDELSEVIEDCRQRLWERTLDLHHLDEIASDAFIVEEALSLSSDYKNIDLDKARVLCKLAIKRAQNARLSAALVIAGEEGMDQVLSKIRNYLVLLGTYELLCRHFAVDASHSRFHGHFLKSSICDLALNFARSADLIALSLLFFRHREEIMGNILDILNQIPLAIDPAFFRHLLPVDRQGGAYSVFVSELTDRSLSHWSQFNAHVSNKSGISLTLDPEDEKRILELNSDFELSKGESDTTVAQWYLGRAAKMQEFVGNLQHLMDFSAFGLKALGYDASELNGQSLRPVIQKLHAVWGCASTLQRMLSDRLDDTHGTNLSLSSCLSLDPDGLLKMDLVDVVSTILSDQSEAIEIFTVYKKYLLPLLHYFPNDKKIEIDEAVKSFCEGLILEVTKEDENQPLAVNGSAAISMSEMEKAVTISATIASASRTSIKKKDRLVKDKQVLLELVLSVIFKISVACENITDSVKETQHIIQLMWDMYESLPKRIHVSEKRNKSLLCFVAKSDLLFQDLVGLDILSRWPGCPAFSFLVKRHNLRKSYEEESSNNVSDPATFEDSLISFGQEIISELCIAFCAQVGSKPQSTTLRDTLNLTNALISDIKQLDQTCFGASLPLASDLSTNLLSPLLQQQQFHLVAKFVRQADDAWIDKKALAKTVQHYVDEAIFAEDNSLNDDSFKMSDKIEMKQSAMRCQDVLGPLFPSLQDHFASIRRQLDATTFINTTIFLGLPNISMPPNFVQQNSSFDTIEFVLAKSPRAIVCGCSNWADEGLARNANEALRRDCENVSRGLMQTEQSNLPPLPGGAVFHLASILGLLDPASALVVKCRVIHYGIMEGLYGSSAAICRTLLHDDNSFANIADANARITAVAEVVTSVKYEDIETKRELCEGLLKRYTGTISDAICKPYGEIVKVFGEVELRTNSSKRGDKFGTPMNSVDRFCRDIWGQYSVDIRHMFDSLQRQTSTCLIDDSLLNALCRYVVFWCIFHFTKARSVPNAFEKATESALLALGLSYMLHMRKADFSLSTFHEIRKIMEEQGSKAMNEYATDSSILRPNEEIVRALVGRGYSANGARRCALATENSSTEAALQWGVSHSMEQWFDDAIVNVFSPRRVHVDKFSIHRIRDAIILSGDILEGKKTIKDIVGSNQIFDVEGPSSISLSVTSKRNHSSRAGGPQANGVHKNSTSATADLENATALKQCSNSRDTDLQSKSQKTRASSLLSNGNKSTTSTPLQPTTNRESAKEVVKTFPLKVTTQSSEKSSISSGQVPKGVGGEAMESPLDGQSKSLQSPPQIDSHSAGLENNFTKPRPSPPPPKGVVSRQSQQQKNPMPPSLPPPTPSSAQAIHKPPLSNQSNGKESHSQIEQASAKKTAAQTDVSNISSDKSSSLTTRQSRPPPPGPPRMLHDNSTLNSRDRPASAVDSVGNGSIAYTSTQVRKPQSVSNLTVDVQDRSASLYKQHGSSLSGRADAKGARTPPSPASSIFSRFSDITSMTDRSALLQQGEAVLKKARAGKPQVPKVGARIGPKVGVRISSKTGSKVGVSEEERKKLIEEGRRIFSKTRMKSRVSPSSIGGGPPSVVSTSNNASHSHVRSRMLTSVPPRDLHHTKIHEEENKHRDLENVIHQSVVKSKHVIEADAIGNDTKNIDSAEDDGWDWDDFA